MPEAILTDINEFEVKSEESGVENGQSIYDLQGRKVQNPVKGQIYIVNGKKTIYR